MVDTVLEGRAPQATAADPGSPLSVPPLREIRLAVVLYGGVSLCIYMNGVVQELLHLVRATAPRSRQDPTLPPAAQLSSTEPVYRRLSQLIGAEETVDATEVADPGTIDDRPALVRFMIDVLSGSSAGGINGVFLAKALANDQDLTALGDLWIEEGDISLLLNDKKSIKKLKPPLDLQRPPQSLLNGQRMYLKLLNAFTTMEGDSPADKDRESRLADELDLYVTTTDLAGLVLPIKLSNASTFERRYRSVFHFKYATDVSTGAQRNDFHQLNNPFLAFAARCTSAFPWAFEPMELTDIYDTMISVDRYASLGRGPDGSTGSWTEWWRAFYADYEVSAITGKGPVPQSVDFPERPFGDGGALDNKPFTYATAALLRRQSDVPVDRKLLFVEPDPGHPERIKDAAGRPDALEDFLKQAVFLPRQETVRDDLQAVFDRNRLIERIDAILQDLDEEASRDGAPTPLDLALAPSTSATVAASYVSADIPERGRAYGGYHAVRIAATTEDLAAFITRVVGLPEEPGYVDAIRYLVSAWRRASYVEHPTPIEEEAGQLPSTNSFLVDFDLRYRIRRINLLQRRIDRLFRLDPPALQMLRAAGFAYWPTGTIGRREFRDELIRIKRGLNEAHRILRTAGRTLRQRPTDEREPGQATTATVPAGSAPSISELVAATGVSVGVLQEILQAPTDQQRRDIAEEHYRSHEDAFGSLARQLSDAVGGAVTQARAALAGTLGGTPPDQESQATARAYLVHSYNTFEDYDSVAFPMLYASETGEADVVEVIRVSPLDATSLADPNPIGGPAKVTGARYGHFGAFLNRPWRERDILWGRLDAAEILISSLAPTWSLSSDEGAATFTELRRHAQRTIVAEQIGLRDRQELVRLLAQVLSEAPPSDSPVEQSLRERIEQAAGTSLPARVLDVLELIAEDEDLLVDHVAETAGEVEPLPPRETLHTIGRAAHIMGDLLNGVAKNRGQARLGLPFVWLARMGALLTGMVEVATPRSFLHLLGRHWLALIVTFEALAIAGGALLSAPDVVQFGLTALVVTLLVSAGVWSLSRLFRKKNWWWSLMALVAAAIIVAVLVLAVLELSHLGRTHSWIPIFGHATTITVSPSPTTPG